MVRRWPDARLPEEGKRVNPGCGAPDENSGHHEKNGSHDDGGGPECGGALVQVVVDVGIGEEQVVSERGKRQERRAQNEHADDEPRRDREGLARSGCPPSESRDGRHPSAPGGAEYDSHEARLAHRQDRDASGGGGDESPHSDRPQRELENLAIGEHRASRK
jgi:hypothetical protein